MDRVNEKQLAMMPIEFKLNGHTVVGRPDEPIITTAKKAPTKDEVNAAVSACPALPCCASG